MKKTLALLALAALLLPAGIALAQDPPPPSPPAGAEQPADHAHRGTDREHRGHPQRAIGDLVVRPWAQHRHPRAQHHHRGCCRSRPGRHGHQSAFAVAEQRDPVWIDRGMLPQPAAGGHDIRH